MSIMKILHIAALTSLGLLMQGCMGGKDSILPQDGPTMKQVYERHFNGESIEQEVRNRNAGVDSEAERDKPIKIGRHRSDLAIKKNMIAHHHNYEENISSFTRTSHNEIQQIFPRLKNRTLIMFIFPHLSQTERHPVPGYSTAFTMYEQTEYALPGEVEEGY